MFCVLETVFPRDHPVDLTASGGRHQDAGQDLDRGGFAGTVGADVAHELALFDRKVNARQGWNIVVRAMHETRQSPPQAARRRATRKVFVRFSTRI